MLSRYLLIIAAILSYVLSTTPLILQPTPPMGEYPPSGFNDWSVSMCGLNESTFIETAYAMINNGMLDAGYNRINLDDCWSKMERAENGSMLWNPEKFPRGLPWLIGYLKSIGFLPGIYTDAGNLSCGGYPGAFGYEELDAKTFESWGFTYLKLDGCNMPTGPEAEYKTTYGKWHNTLKKLDQTMVFSESAPAYFAEAANLTDWYSVMDWVPKFGQLARHSRDTLVFNSTSYWPNITGWDSIMFNYGQEVRLARYQRPGYFNDPDFLNVDYFDYTPDEKKSHFAIWASLSAPLIVSAVVPAFTADEVKYLTNKDIIAIDQDPLALQATLVSQDGTWDVLTKNLANNDRLLTIINRGNHTGSFNVSFERIGIPDVKSAHAKNLWTSTFSLVNERVVSVNVPRHGTAIYRLSGFDASRKSIPTGIIFNTFSLNTLTSSSHSVSWANSAGTDGQVWQTLIDGTIRSLADDSKCLTELKEGSVTLSSCSSGETKLTQEWDHLYSGNIRNRRSKLCLTEAPNSTVTNSKCLYEDNRQVFALPSGVVILES